MRVRSCEFVLLLAVAIAFGSAGAASGQAPPTTPQPVEPALSLRAVSAELAAAFAADRSNAETTSGDSQAPDRPAWVAERRACEGCPPRSVGKAFLWTTLVNVGYGSVNLARGQVTGRITPKSWWVNMQQGWVWDLDDFTVNQIGHPYQGNNYFNSARSNGLGFYESAALTAFGSATWEYFGETNYASLNDLLNTTLGGAALGEMFHRAAWLVRNPRATGRQRLWSEIGATALDPITGVNRFISGDASRVTDRPGEFVPNGLGGTFALGALWRGTNTDWFRSSGQPFLEMNLLYGDPWTGRSRTAYEAFLVRLRFGGGGGFSEAHVRGRLLGEPFGPSQHGQFMVVQAYDFQNNDAYSYGAQSFSAFVTATRELTSRTKLWFGASGGLTVLGAVDSLPADLDERPEEPEQSPGDGPGQGVAEGPRYYDYGPGSNFGGFVQLMRDERALVGFTYEGRHLYSLDGVRANHFLQQARLDVTAPIRGQLGIGVTAEYLDRQTFFQDEDRTVKRYHYPQFRGYFTWDLSTVARAQPTRPPAAPAASTARAATPTASDFWLAIGAAAATLRSDCEAPPSPLSPITCGSSPYRHSGSVLANVGYRVNTRLDVGGEIFWMPQETDRGHIRVTHFDAVAQFRPWESSGFFIKGGAGMAYLRNWVDAVGPESIDQKALSVVLGGGWAFRPTERLGYQLFAAQHVGAVGDVPAEDGFIENVTGNFWSVGAAVVIR